MKQQDTGSWYLIFESEMSNSRCMRCLSVPWFSFRLVVTTAKNGFLASKGLGGEESSSVTGQVFELNVPALEGYFWFHRTLGTSELASKGHEETSPVMSRVSQPDLRLCS